MPPTIELTEEQLRQRRRDLLTHVGLSEKVLRDRAQTYTLQPDERKAFEALRAIDFLLDER